MFGILLNVTAGIGAVGFAWMDDFVGPKPTVLVSLIALTGLGTAILLVDGKTTFYVLGLAIGLFIGPVQSASRSLMARLAPPELRTEMFGLYALSGKITSFLGPAAVAWATVIFSSQRAGMATILAFFLLGLGLLATLRLPPHAGGRSRP